MDSRQFNIFPLGGTLRVKRDQLLFRLHDSGAKRVAVWGAGKNGDAALCLLAGTGVEVAAVYDAKPAGSLHGINVSPEPDAVPSGIDCVLIAMNGPEAVVKRLEAMCAAAKVPSINLMDMHRAPLQEVRRPALSEFAGRHKGRRCFVAGNGPSLNMLDMSRLKDEIVFGSNRCFLGFDRWGVQFPYWGVEDEIIGGWQSEEWGRLKGSMKFIPTDMLHLAEPGDGEVCPVNLVRVPFQKREPLFSVYPEVAFTGRTVTYLLLQLAATMGCSPIYLIGVDFHFTQGNVELKDNGETWSQTDLDLNHFDPSYIPKGRRLNRPYWDLQRLAFESARKAAATYGFEIFNATPGSKLDVFERVEYESLFA